MNANLLQNNRPVGLFLMFLGLMLLWLCVGDLIIRIACAIGALMLINYGMRVAGMQPVHQMAMQAYFSRFR